MRVRKGSVVPSKFFPEHKKARSKDEQDAQDRLDTQIAEYFELEKHFSPPEEMTGASENLALALIWMGIILLLAGSVWVSL